MHNNYFCVLIINTIITSIQGARILGISGWPAVSHQATYLPIFKELSLRGHQVTALVTNPLKDKSLTNLTEIDVSETYDALVKNDMKNSHNSRWLFTRVMFMRHVLEEISETIISNEKVMKLINDKNQEFDLIIVEPHHPLVFAFSARFKAPVIALSSLGVFLEIHDATGNPTHPVISPDIFFDMDVSSKTPPFKDRLNSFCYNIWYRLAYYWYLLPKADRIARKYFGNDMPYLGDLAKNVSLVLTNVNPVMHTVRANVANVVEIGQLHIKNKKTPLPEDVQTYLNTSLNGVVYFSLGTSVIVSNFGDEMIRTIAGALSELPYDVLWKWEKDKLPVPKPNNVMLRKWLPQQDVLGHPKIKVFVTQGGIQSIEEAIFKEVPMVGMPFLGDQPFNVRRIVDLGIAQMVDTDRLNKQSLTRAILDVAENKKYKENIRITRQLLEDQPIRGLEKAVWWIEYVLRHRGASHLKSPATDMSFFDYFMLDVIIFLILISAIVTYVICKILTLIFLIFSDKKMKTD